MGKGQAELDRMSEMRCRRASLIGTGVSKMIRLWTMTSAIWWWGMGR